MRRADAVDLMRRLHAAQNQLYQGGNPRGVVDLLTPDIDWHVPGDNAIAGDYHGLEDVLGYMRRRRDLAAATMTMHLRELLIGEHDHIAARTDGTATIDGVDHHWSTLGLYRITEQRTCGHRIAECWLLPLDPHAFDHVWSR